MFPKTFSPVKIGPLELKNRLIMAPLTRQVAELDGTPTDEMAAYYARRARVGIGMIISEGTYETDELSSKTYLSQLGIANDKHVQAWTKETDAVHAFGMAVVSPTRGAFLKGKALFLPLTHKAMAGCFTPTPTMS
ncbi:MAG: hypothetical protein AAF231_01835 [Pseudomonadota bacterium]